MLRSFPVFPVAGNHDYKTDDAGPFREVFALPENGGPEGTERWYSFDWGDVHFVAIDTERVGPKQAAWLDADLADNQLPWTVVFAHKSPYSSGSHGSDRNVREVFGPILEFHRVPLMLAGHDHNYERSEQINGVTYVVTGGGGRGTRAVGRSEFTAFSHDVLCDCTRSTRRARSSTSPTSGGRNSLAASPQDCVPERALVRLTDRRAADIERAGIACGGDPCTVSRADLGG
jgi:hypothetical protein